MKIFVTGGRGMVGSNIVALCKNRGIEVLNPSRSELNLMDLHGLSNFINRHNPDAIIHCAGRVGGIQANIAAPYDFCAENLQMGLNILNASLQGGIDKFINLGSSCMYPRSAENPLKEESILTGELEPTNEGYAIAKVAIARMGQYAESQFGVSYKTVIPCNLYGYWDSFDPVRSHMIPAVIRKIYEADKAGVDSVEIWGDGKARREFMFAEDLADFILFTLDKYEKVPSLINCGLGYDYSVNDYYHKVSELIGYSGKFTHDLSKPSGMKQKLVDINKQQKLGWTPKHHLDEGIQKTIDHFIKEVL